MKRLPVGINEFGKLIKNDYVYVDKTKDIHRLITHGDYYFLSRPRRFGKSLLISTLHELFDGNREYFKNLWIAQSGYSWQPHPVIHLDFTIIDYKNTERLEQSIAHHLHKIARSYNLTLDKTASAKDLLGDLIGKLATKKGPVVILIDEYDKPILDHVDNTQEACAQRKVLQSFYSVIKGFDKHIRFVLLTGVTKFSKTSIFSGINNLEDISLDREYATLLGYTREEVITFLEPHIMLLARAKKITFNQAIKLLKAQYDGYCFAEHAEPVFNPYSILCSLKKLKISNYWFETGTPTFLTHLIKTRDYDIHTIDHPILSEDELGTLDVEDIPLTTLLFQTGYLTIKSYKADEYTLDFPNNEVGKAFNLLITKSFARLTSTQSRMYAKSIAQALADNDLEKFRAELQDLFDTIPYPLQARCERDLQLILYSICRLIGIDVDPEVITSVGRADLIITLPSIIYIIELKFGRSAQTALEQILDRRYYAKYIQSGKKTILVGIAFDSKMKTVTLAHQPAPRIAKP